MLHKRRVWQVFERTPDVGGLSQLAYELTQMTWCGCNGFAVGNFLILNDSTGGDGAQEYGIVDRRTLEQLESVTFSWMTEAKAMGFLLSFLSSPYYDFRSGRIDPEQIEAPLWHKAQGGCELCH